MEQNSLLSSVWLVIPAYNEARNIGSVLPLLADFAGRIIVVDDCSSDETYRICQNFNCHLLRHPVNLGQGAALQTGMEYALRQGAEIMVHFDGDGQMKVGDIPKMVEPILNRQAQVTIGSRYLGVKNKVPFTKKFFIHKPAIILNWIFTGLLLSDAHCGFRALNREAAKACKLTQNRMAHATEILELINLHDLKYLEVPVEISYNQYGQNWSKGLAIVKDLLFSKVVK